MEALITVGEISAIVKLLGDCDTNVFLDNFDRWYSRLIVPIEKLSKSDSVDDDRLLLSTQSIFLPRAAVLAFCRLLPAVIEFPEISKESSTSKINRLLQALTRCPSWFDQWALMGVNICLVNFPNCCNRNFAKTILPFVDRCSKSTNEIARNRSASCVALFPLRVANIQRNGVWNQQLNYVLFSLHETALRSVEALVTHDENNCQLSIILKNKIADGNVGVGDTSKFLNQLFQTGNIDEIEKLETTNVLENRVKFLMEILRSMFSEYDNFVVSVNVQNFVDLFLCSIALAEKLKTSKENIFDLIIDLLRFIGEQLIPAIGISAASFSSIFVDGSMRLLRLCREGPYRVVESVYVLLTSVAKHIGPASLASFQRMASKSLEFTDQILLGNSTISENESKQPSANVAGKRKTQKRKAVLMDEMSSDRLIVRNRSEISIRRNDAAKSCFRMWQCILKSGGGFLKTNDFRRLQQTVCRSLLQNQNRTLANQSSSFGDPDFRCESYRLLIDLVTCSHPFRSSTLQCAIRIFDIGSRRDDDSKVIDVCKNGLSICDALAKPRLPYLESVLVDEEEKESDDRSNDIFTKRSGGENFGFRGLISVHPPVPESLTSPRGTIEPPIVKPIDESTTSVSTYYTAMEEPKVVDLEDQIRKGGEAPISESAETVTIEDDDDGDETETVPCVEKKKIFGDAEVAEKTDNDKDKDNAEVNTMLGDFIEMPAEEIDVYID